MISTRISISTLTRYLLKRNIVFCLRTNRHPRCFLFSCSASLPIFIMLEPLLHLQSLPSLGLVHELLSTALPPGFVSSAPPPPSRVTVTGTLLMASGHHLLPFPWLQIAWRDWKSKNLQCHDFSIKCSEKLYWYMSSSM